MEITHEYVKLRKDFGKHPNFKEFHAELIYDLRPDEERKAKMIKRQPCTTTVQVIPQFSERTVNTAQTTYRTVGMAHMQGGWPRDVDVNEPSQVSRYIKRVERDEDYIASVSRLSSGAIATIRQNNALDIYEQFFTDVQEDHSSEVPEARTLTVLSDPNKIKRSATYLSFHPGGRKVACAYSLMKFQSQPHNMELKSYMWDMANPTAPELELVPASQLCCINFNPKDEHLLGAGQYNGQFALFDRRKGKTPVETSLIESSHKDPVYDNAWLQSKTGSEIMTASTDGQVLFWDIRRMSEPLEDLTITEKNSDLVLGAVSMEYDAAAGATKFMVGTEQGVVVSCNRKAKTPADRIGASYAGHKGPVYALKRNPFFSKYFMTVADWTAMMWNEDIRQPIITTPYHSSNLTGGTWSPTRPGVFFLTRMSGHLDCWDLYHKASAPILSIEVDKTPLVSLSIQPQGKVLGVGTEDGSIHVLELSDSLVHMQQGEKASIGQTFERETRREKNLEARAKELKVRARKAAQKEEEGELGKIPEEELLRIEKEFFETVKEQEAKA
ncbi:unnamed protein product [Pedinophyceae sp. YPF-701]|nr:unnamed protein product [Pedinophyceae sp. YPF-701]